MEPIKLLDGTEWIPLEPTEKEALEAELKTVLDKYNAMYMPVVRKIETIQEIRHTASLFLLKKKEQGLESTNPEVNPLIDETNGENTKESETPEVN